MSELRPTFAQLAPVLDALRAVGDAKSRASGRTIVTSARRFLEDGGYRRFDGAFQEAMEAFEEAVAPFDQLDALIEKRRGLERQLEDVRTETVRLRRGRCERTVDHAVRRGAVQRHEREETIRRLEEGDENLRSAIDPLYAPAMPDDATFEREFTATYREEPSVPAPPKSAEEAQRRELAATLGIREEEVL